VQDLLALAASNRRRAKSAYARAILPRNAGRDAPTADGDCATLALLLLWSGNRLHDHLALARQADAAVQASRDFYRQWFKAEKNLVNHACKCSSICAVWKA
jgi:general secretion pathway protein L